MAGEKSQGGSSTDANNATTPNLGTDTGAAQGANTAPPNLGTDAPAQDKKTGGEPAKFEFKPPEGFDKDPFFEKYEDFAKDLGLDSEKGQKLAERYSTIAKAEREAMKAEATQQVESWGKALMADKELGGAKFKESFATAKQALDRIATTELKQFLITSGMGSHPEVVRVFYRLGKAISEENAGGSGSPTKTPATDDATFVTELYPNTKF